MLMTLHVCRHTCIMRNRGAVSALCAGKCTCTCSHLFTAQDDDGYQASLYANDQWPPSYVLAAGTSISKAMPVCRSNTPDSRSSRTLCWGNKKAAKLHLAQ